MRLITSKMKLLILFTGVMLAILVFVSVFIGSGKPASLKVSPSPSSIASFQPSLIPVPSLNPYSSPLLTPAPLPQKKLTKEEFLRSMPVITDLFNIEYFDTTGSLWITIKEDPYEENKQEAIKWLRDRGLNPDELNIKWNKYISVQ